MESIRSKGAVTAVLVGEGARRTVENGRNTLLYRCSDAFAHVLAGDEAYRPYNIVFASGPASSGASFVFTQGDRTNKTRSEIITGALVAGTEVVRIGPNPVFSPSDDGGTYSGNSVTFSAMTANNASEKYVYGVLLEDREGRVLAVKRFDDAGVRRSANFALHVSWTISFDELTASVATPTITVSSGSATLACTTTGASIRYTTDGSVPTPESALYTAPFAVGQSVTVKARGYKTGCLASAVAVYPA